MGISGKADRTGRLRELKSGAWGSNSADFVHLIRCLLEHSLSLLSRLSLCIFMLPRFYFIVLVCYRIVRYATFRRAVKSASISRAKNVSSAAT